MQNFLVKLISVIALVMFPIAFLWAYNRRYAVIEGVGDAFRIAVEDWKSTLWNCETFSELLR